MCALSSSAQEKVAYLTSTRSSEHAIGDGFGASQREAQACGFRRRGGAHIVCATQAPARGAECGSESGGCNGRLRQTPAWRAAGLTRARRSRGRGDEPVAGTTPHDSCGLPESTPRGSGMPRLWSGSPPREARCPLLALRSNLSSRSGTARLMSAAYASHDQGCAGGTLCGPGPSCPSGVSRREAQLRPPRRAACALRLRSPSTYDFILSSYSKHARNSGLGPGPRLTSS
jgi:hypothetical protein